MNLDSSLEKNYRSKKINDMKEELRKERAYAFGVMLDLLKEQHKIILDIREEKKTLRKNKQLLKQEREAREEQKRNTNDFFRIIYRKLQERTQGNINLCARYAINSHLRDGQLNKFLVEGVINLDLFHSICYENNVFFNTSLDHVNRVLSLEFVVNPTKTLTADQYNSLKTNNYANFDYFYKNYAVSRKIYPPISDNSENNNGQQKKKGKK